MNGPGNHLLVPGEVIRLGNNLFGRCWRCHKFLRLNKFIIGAWHWCSQLTD